MRRTIYAVVVALTVGIYLGLAVAFGPAGALVELLILGGYAAVAFYLSILALGAWALLSSYRREEVDDVEAARRAYAAGEIPLSEMERRVDVALDPQARRLRDLVENVKGVGPETSATIAAEFMTIDALENASPADLEKLYGIGPNTAYAIHRRFNYEPPDERATEAAAEETVAESNS